MTLGMNFIKRNLAALLSVMMLCTLLQAIVITTSPPAVALTCAQGGSCIVGDRGPGGGIIFYVAASNFSSPGSVCNTSCRYLEVAPSTWRTGAVQDDTTFQWSSNTTDQSTQNSNTAGSESGLPGEKFNWKIGQGSTTRV